MKIHEYQAKEILKSYGVPVPKGGVAEIPEEARKIAEGIGEKAIVVKAQIHAKLLSTAELQHGNARFPINSINPKSYKKRFIFFLTCVSITIKLLYERDMTCYLN